MIDEETRRMITEYMDEIGVPCTNYEGSYKSLVNQAVVFAFKWCKPAFEYWYSECEK